MNQWFCHEANRLVARHIFAIDARYITKLKVHFTSKVILENVVMVHDSQN